MRGSLFLNQTCFTARFEEALVFCLSRTWLSCQDEPDLWADQFWLGMWGSLGSVTRRQLGTCLPRLDTSGKARLSKYMGQYRVLRKIRTKGILCSLLLLEWLVYDALRSALGEPCSLCVLSASHTALWPYPCAIWNPARESHACSNGLYQSKTAFYLTRNALFSYFSILRAETVTPLSGELKWDCLLWYNAHIYPPPSAAGVVVVVMMVEWNGGGEEDVISNLLVCFIT